MRKEIPQTDPDKYQKYDYLVDESFLDLVLGHMYTTRGTYHTVTKIQEAVEAETGKKMRHNDFVMALEKLERDKYLCYEGEREPGHHVYRLTYDGYITFKSSQRSAPYQDLIASNKRNSRYNKSKTLINATNAIAIVIITSITAWSHWSRNANDQRAGILEKRTSDMANQIEAIKKENIDLRFRVIEVESSHKDSTARVEHQTKDRR